jgi:2-polyprenyl-6-methoxyphenol hydroxylase-like FAD-dependent oxidoreductase
MAAAKLKVLISGAGIAGPCLAYWLARTRLNLSITILERSPVPRITGQSIDIRGRAVGIIKEMDLEEAIRARTTTEEGTKLLDSKGKEIAYFGMGDVFTADYEILRGDLADLFMEATKKFDNIEYKYGDYVDSLEQTEKGVEVTFAGGGKNTFDLIVGADGSTSRTRTMILDEPTLKDSYKFIGQYIAFFSIPSQPTDDKIWYCYSAPKGLGLMTRPHRNPNTIGVYLCITMSKHGKRDQAVEDAMSQGTDATKKILRTYFENTGWQAKRILDGMDGSEDFYMAKAAQVKLPKWTEGRGVVVGDAAFATFGVGTTLAIESTYVLAGELSKIKHSSEIPEALKRYESVFRPIYAKSENLPPGFPQLGFPQTALGMKIRHSILWFVSKTKVYKLIPEDAGMQVVLPSYDWEEARE